jgi:hypothetical protein
MVISNLNAAQPPDAQCFGIRRKPGIRTFKQLGPIRNNSIQEKNALKVERFGQKPACQIDKKR